MTDRDHAFSHLRGQDAAIGLLTAGLAAGRAPHAYLFVGPEGVGKRAAARAWAGVLLCEHPPAPVRACGVCGSCRQVAGGGHPDLLWIDYERQAALAKEPVDKQKSLKIDTVRDMEHSLRLKPLEARAKVAVLDPADALVDAAAHALLKILEEPPPATHLVLLAREATSLLPTLRSRCQTVRFRPLAAPVLAELIRGLKPELTEEEARAAARGAEGSLGRALSRLESTTAVDFDWAAAPLSELLGWCEGFGNPRLGRPAAERFVESLLARLGEGLREGRHTPDDLRRALTALHRLKRNAHVTLVLQTLLLALRKNARARPGAAA